MCPSNLHNLTSLMCGTWLCLQDLTLSTEEIARLRGADVENVLRDRKLYLVLDLDHTLLNSTRIIDISPQEEYLNGPHPLKGMTPSYSTWVWFCLLVILESFLSYICIFIHRTVLYENSCNLCSV